MNLGDLRAMFRNLIFDRAPEAEPFGTTPESGLSTNALDRLINTALHQVWAIALAQQDYLFTAVHSQSIGPVTTAYHPVTLSGATYTRIKRLLAAWRTDGTTPGPLAVKHVATAGFGLERTTTPQPALLQVGEGLVLLNGATTQTISLYYLHGLPDMTHVSNTPGQTGAGDTGDANKLPIEYHPLIALKAAVLGLQAMRAADWQSLEMSCQQYIGQMQAALAVGQRGAANQ